MNILGIDTSCDDTSAAIVENGKKIHSLVVTSQDDFHRKYGGIVPEIASRKHLELTTITIDEALKRWGGNLDDVDGVAVTSRPGLIGSLVIGIANAKSIAYTKAIPLTAVNHIRGHAYALAFNNELSFPHLALIVSGGHTLTALVNNNWSMNIIGHTRDDAAGECLDKVSKMLGLGYPGGRLIDEISKNGNPTAFHFPRPMLHDKSPHFSFSGLKTAVRVFLEKQGNKSENLPLNDFLASVQEAVMEVLAIKTLKTAKKHQINLITVSGGVAANSRLRQLFSKYNTSYGNNILFPEPILCTDNAAVIAGIGYHQLQNGQTAAMDLNAQARISLK